MLAGHNDKRPGTGKNEFLAKNAKSAKKTEQTPK
jgi:hypothetical protein